MGSGRPDFLGDVTTISGRTADNHAFQAIPFYALANRTESNQAVWIAQESPTANSLAWNDELYRALKE